MTEETKELSVSDMLKLTGTNTADFMKRVAEHVDELEGRIRQLQDRVTELESQSNVNE
jgi:TolA-binding protein